MKETMADMWKLKPGIEMAPDTATEVAKIACALKSLSAYASMAYGEEAVPEDLQKLVDEGLEAIPKLFAM